MIEIIMMSLMILAGLLLVYFAIYSKNKDIEMLFITGATDLILLVINLVFNFSPIRFKSILLFLFGVFWSGLFLLLFIKRRY